MMDTVFTKTAEDLSAYIEQELERRSRAWIDAAKGTDFTKLLVDVTSERDRLRRDIILARGEIERHQVTIVSLRKELQGLHESIEGLAPSHDV